MEIIQMIQEYEEKSPILEFRIFYSPLILYTQVVVVQKVNENRYLTKVYKIHYGGEREEAQKMVLTYNALMYLLRLWTPGLCSVSFQIKESEETPKVFCENLIDIASPKFYQSSLELYNGMFLP